MLLPFRLEDGGAERGGFDLDAGVARKDDIAAGMQEVVVDGKRSGIESDAGGEIATAGSDANDASDESETIGGYAGLGSEVAVFIESAASEHGEQQRSDGTGLIARSDGALGIKREVLRLFSGGACERAFDLAAVALGKLDLLESEAKFAIATEGAGGPGGGDFADKFRALRNHELAVFVVDRFNDESFDGIAGLGGSGGKIVRERGVDGPDLGLACAGSGGWRSGKAASLGRAVSGRSTGAVSSKDQAVCASMRSGWYGSWW